MKETAHLRPALNAIRPFPPRSHQSGGAGLPARGAALSLMLGFLGLIAVAAVITFLIFAA